MKINLQLCTLAIAAIALQPPVQAFPKGATTPLVSWLVGAWVFEGGKCSVSPDVYLPNGVIGSVRPGKGIVPIGRYSLKGNVLTTVVDGGKYGDLTNVTRIASTGPNEMVSELMSKSNPNLSIPKQRRCPEQPGYEPWFPKIKFQGMARYRVPG